MNVLFIIFNRPDETKKVFEMIRKAKPDRLFIAADGPRRDKISDSRLCEEVRIITNSVDWQCEVITKFQIINMGCKHHVSSAITWFFEHVEEGIILEDDCCPDMSFFSFCSELLERYRNNEKIMHISGSNFQSQVFGDGSYYFSHSPHIWGWATWKRAWNYYDLEMNELDTFIKSKKIYSTFKDRKVSRFWISLFKHIKKRNIDTWDAQWAFSIMNHDGLCATTNFNLVENIGIGSGTHTSKDSLDERNTQSLKHLVHPTEIEVLAEADILLAKRLYIKPWYRRILNILNI